MDNLERIQLRYFPPGLNLVYKENEKVEEQ